MTAKEWFGRVLEAQEELDALKMQQDKLTSLCYPGAAEIREVVQDGHLPSSKAEKYVELREELEAKYMSRSVEWMQLLRDADRVISMIPKARHREVLQYRYLCGLTWEGVRIAMKYSDVRSAHKVHGWALRDAEKIMMQLGIVCHP